MAEPQIRVLSGADRATARDQISEVIARARAKGEPVRIRIPFSLYDHDTSRAYVFVRDATWNLSLPAEETEPETVENLIQVIGRCIVSVATAGSAAVLQALDTIPPIQLAPAQVAEADAPSVTE